MLECSHDEATPRHPILSGVDPNACRLPHAYTKCKPSPYTRRLMVVLGYAGDDGDGPSNVDDADDGPSNVDSCAKKDRKRRWDDPLGRRAGARAL